MKRILPVILASLVFSAFAEAQTKAAGAPRTEVKATVGWYGYDEDPHPVVGGAFAYYPFSQASVELEGLYILPRKSEAYERFGGFALTPSFGLDARRVPVSVQPFGRIAYSIDHSRQMTRTATTPNAKPAEKSSKSNGSLGIRFGFKFYVGDRFFVYPEFGLGEKVLWKATLSAGYVTSQR